MAAWFGLSGVGGTVAGVSVATVVVAGGMAGYVMMTRDPDPQEQVAPPVESPVETAPEESGTNEPEVASVETAPEPNTDPVVAEEATPEVEAPSFDVVHVDPDGNALIAGRSEPSSTISVQIDGVEAHRAKTDGGGSFAAFLTIPPAQQPRVVSLIMEREKT